MFPPWTPFFAWSASPRPIGLSPGQARLRPRRGRLAGRRPVMARLSWSAPRSSVDRAAVSYASAYRLGSTMRFLRHGEAAAVLSFHPAPVAQWIERGFPKPGAEVRFLPGAFPENIPASFRDHDRRRERVSTHALTQLTNCVQAGELRKGTLPGGQTTLTADTARTLRRVRALDRELENIGLVDRPRVRRGVRRAVNTRGRHHRVG